MPVLENSPVTTIPSEIADHHRSWNSVKNSTVTFVALTTFLSVPFGLWNWAQESRAVREAKGLPDIGEVLRVTDIKYEVPIAVGIFTGGESSNSYHYDRIVIVDQHNRDVPIDIGPKEYSLAGTRFPVRPSKWINCDLKLAEGDEIVVTGRHDRSYAGKISVEKKAPTGRSSL